MRLCDQTITVFNAKLDPDTGNDVYYPTVISGVSWFQQTITTVDSSGLKAANQITVRIPDDAETDFSGKSYVTPEEYATADPSSVFTLRAGDLLVHAAVTERLRPAELQQRYGEAVATVLAVTDDRRTPHAPHWKVVGK